MAGRKINIEQDAHRCLQGVKSERSTLGKWAKAHGVDGRSLHAWKMALERRGTTRTSAMVPRLVEIIPATSVSKAARYVLRIHEVELEVGRELRRVSRGRPPTRARPGERPSLPLPE